MTTSRVLAVGLDVDELEVLQTSGAEAIAVADACDARRCLDEEPTGVQAVVARFDEADAWALSSLFAGVRRRCRQVPILLVTDVPRPALPVLITDLSGLRLLVPGDADELRTALRGVIEPDELMLGRALA